MCWKKISQGYFRSQLSFSETSPNTQCGAVGCAQITPWNSSRPLFSAPCPKHSVIIRFYVTWPLKLEESGQINQKQAIDLFRLINAQHLAPKPAVLQLRNWMGEMKSDRDNSFLQHNVAMLNTGSRHHKWYWNYNLANSTLLFLPLHFQKLIGELKASCSTNERYNKAYCKRTLKTLRRRTFHSVGCAFTTTQQDYR